jgi:alpha-D-ribose 1-methylphosphonate 5-triphosphate synthase subunit PhnG
MLQVREPVRRERFYLGEVVVTRCEVTVAEQRGWAMVAGEHDKAALAAAVCDCVSRTSEPGLAALRASIDQLCAETAERLASARSQEWSTLEPTRVAFEEFE